MTTLATIDATLRYTPGRSDQEIAALLRCGSRQVAERRTALIVAGIIPDRRLAHYGGWLPPQEHTHA